MKKNLNKRLAVLFVLLCVLSLNIEVHAQCAMCRAAVENNISTGESSVGAGLNTGIIYLMLMPYILFSIVAIAWYRYSKRETLAKMKLQRILKFN